MNPRAVLAIAKKDVILASREKMVLFFLIAYPVMMLFFAATLFVPSPKPVTLYMGVVYEDATIAEYSFNATSIVSLMNQTRMDNVEIFQARLFESQTQAIEEMRKGELDAIIVFPPKFSENISLSYTSELRIYISGVDIYKTQISEAVLRGFFDHLSKGIASTRIESMRQYVPPSNMTWNEIRLYLYGLSFPLAATFEKIAPETVSTKEGTIGVYTVGMIGVQFLFIGMQMAANAIVVEKERKTLRRILSTPISPWDLLLGKTLAILCLLVFTSMICLLFGVAMGARIQWNPIQNPLHWMVPILLLLGALLTIGIGLTLSSICKSSEAGAGITMLIGFPLIFITGIWFPKFMLPPVLQRFAEVFPLAQTIDGAREIMIYGGDLSKIIVIIPSVVISAVLVYAIGSVLFRWSVKKEF